MNCMKNGLMVEDIITVLVQLDKKCREQGTVADLIMLGASAISMYFNYRGFTFRPTRDIDVNVTATSNMEQLRSLLLEKGIDIIGGVIDVPPMEDFKDGEKFEISGDEFTNIRVFVPTIELLACAKIFSTRAKDLEDLKNSDILNLCNKEKLLEMIEEYKQYALNVDNPFLNLRDLECIFHEKGL